MSHNTPLPWIKHQIKQKQNTTNEYVKLIEL